MKRLLISVAILMFATVLFVHKEETTVDDDLAKDEIVISTEDQKLNS